MDNQNTIVLITDRTGFLGVHSILQLLPQVYKVKTTIRTSSKKDKVLNMLKNGGIHHFENLSFLETDLTQNKDWDNVRHFASSIHLQLLEHALFSKYLLSNYSNSYHLKS